MKIEQALKKSSVIGIAGSRSTGKTSLALSHMVDLRVRYPKLSLAVYGIEESLFPYMRKNKITIIQNKYDILDLKLRDCVIYVAEFAMFFETTSRSKQLSKLMRFFDRIEHLNCKFLIDTAREGYYNKFFCARVNCFMVKKVEYDSLVNGTWLKESVKGIASTSDYRLECPTSDYYLVSNDNTITSKNKFRYNKCLDSKKTNKDLFEVKK